ncbi:MAG: ACP S-malonyltransferase [Candidatus Cloacimonetes bacterium]|nr:ACP S-malonyltransferase [Candidatus Cloacimonadota bacterium]MBS3766525.1 ACP S-malonyltransferase [Candidatus Cloacimonadota bacterium]
MKKFAFVFPGQGAQYVGMAKEFHNIPEYKKYFKIANERLGYDLENIMLNGPAEELKQTFNTQPAILLHSILAYNYFNNHCDIKPELVAGHSLGEFSALVAAEVLDWQDALHLVHKRGKFMVDANEGTPYKMAAILGLDKDIIKEICENTHGVVIAANFNTPKQTVISGEEKSVSDAMKKCDDKGAKRIVPLLVGGAFHSPLIKKSSKWLYKEMQKIDFASAKVPVISNYTAKPELEPNEIINNLKMQIISPVRWVDCVRYMSNNDIDAVVEFGPKKVVSRMIRSIDRSIDRFSVSQPKDVDKVLKKLEK